MGDENDGDAPAGDVLHDGNQLGRLGLRQHGGGLVKHQQLHAGFVDFPGDFHELHIAHGERAHQGIFGNVDAHAVQRLAGILFHFCVVQKFQILAQQLAHRPGIGDLPVQLDVLGDLEAGNQHELLMHHADALFHGIHGGRNLYRVSVHQHLALEAAGGMDDGHAEEHVHQGTLARTVFTQQGVNLAGADFQGNILQNGVFAVELGDMVHFKDILCQIQNLLLYITAQIKGYPLPAVSTATGYPFIKQIARTRAGGAPGPGDVSFYFSGINRISQRSRRS